MDRIARLRVDYGQGTLDEADLAGDPLTQFHSWLGAALDAGLAEPNAMTLATVDADGRPSARTVLCRGVDATGFRFFTNRESRKGQALAENPRAALVFLWEPLQRQVIVTGDVELLPDADSDAYFATRPAGSRRAAWASPQSAVVSSRAEVDRLAAEARARFPDDDAIPRPPHWGGYRVVPATVEFWQGRRDRLHDRLRYRRDRDGWIVERLAP